MKEDERINGLLQLCGFIYVLHAGLVLSENMLDPLYFLGARWRMFIPARWVLVCEARGQGCCQESFYRHANRGCRVCFRHFAAVSGICRIMRSTFVRIHNVFQAQTIAVPAGALRLGLRC